MKVKIRYTTILVAALFCLIPILSVLMIHHLTLTETLTKMGSGTLGASDSVVKLHGNVSCDVVEGAANQKKTAVYIDESTESGTIRAIYFQKEYVNLPMKEGRFFLHTDFTEGNRVAVIGKGREKEIFLDEEGNQCISVKGDSYRVLGIIGYEKETVLDDYIYINLKVYQQYDSPILIIDYLNDQNGDELTWKYLERLEESGVSSELIAGGTSYSETIMPKVIASRWFVLILLCCGICLLLASVLWIRAQKREVAVRLLTGASKGEIWNLIAGKYMISTILSFLIGGAYCYFWYPSYLMNLVKGYLMSLVFVGVFLLYSVHSLLRVNIQEVLK